MTSGQAPPERTVLVASGYTGHDLPYLRLIWEDASNCDVRLVFALMEAGRDAREFDLHLGDIKDNLEIYWLDKPISPKWMARLASDVGAAHVLIPNGDRFMARLAIGPRRWRHLTFTTLVMQDPRWEISALSGVHAKGRVKLMLAQLCSRRPNVRVVWLRGPGYDQVSSELFVNDPVIPGAAGHDSEVAHALEALDRDRYWFAMIGVTNWWKNPSVVLEALRALPSDRAGLLIAGPIAPDSAAEVAAGIVRIGAGGAEVVVLDRHLSNGEMNDVVRSVDCVVVAYSTHAPASTIGKVGAYGSRVIVAGSESLRSHADFLGELAIQCDLDAGSIAAAMRLAMSTHPSGNRPTVLERFTSVLLAPCAEDGLSPERESS